MTEFSLKLDKYRTVVKTKLRNSAVKPKRKPDIKPEVDPIIPKYMKSVLSFCLWGFFPHHIFILNLSDVVYQNNHDHTFRNTYHITYTNTHTHTHTQAWFLLLRSDMIWQVLVACTWGSCRLSWSLQRHHDSLHCASLPPAVITIWLSYRQGDWHKHACREER